MEHDVGMNLLQQRNGFWWRKEAIAESVLQPVELGEGSRPIDVLNQFETQDSGSIE